MNPDDPLDAFSLNAIFDMIRDAVVTLNPDHQIMACNPAVETVLGYRPADLTGQSILRLIPKNLYQEHEAVMDMVQNGKPVAEFRSVWKRADGAQMAVAVRISPIKNKQDRVMGSAVIIRDIRSEIHAELTINKLSTIIDDSEDAVVSKTLDGIITSWNPAAERLFGYTKQEVLGQPITLIIPKDRLSEEQIILNRIRAGEKIENFETVRLTKAGKLLPISLRVSPILDLGGKVVGVFKIVRSIAVKQVADERQARLAAIVDSSDDAIIAKTLEGVVMTWNAGAENIFGYKELEAIGKHISFIIPEDRLEEENSILSSIRSGKKIDHFHTNRKRKDGTLVTVSLTISPIKNAKGKVIGASKVARDITKEQIGNEALRQYAERLQILNALAKAISEKLDVHDILQKVTDYSTQLTGAAFGAFFYNVASRTESSSMFYTLSGAAKEDFDQFGMPGHTPIFHHTFSGAGILRSADIKKDTRYGQVPPHYGTPKGHMTVTSFLSVPVFSAGGKVIGGLFFGHPEPDRFTAEHEDLVANMAVQAGVALDNSALFEQVSELSQKKDEFIGLAAHELKTPLTTMSGFLQLLKSRLDDPVNNSFLDKCLRQLNKLTALINNLFDVSKIQAGKLQLQYENFDLVGLVREVLEPKIQGGNHQILLLSEAPLLIDADRMKLEQVITNFIDNAIKYSPQGAPIRVRIEDRGMEVLFSVQDEGIGISQSHLPNIFGQFYRVEGLNQKISGMGLGLYISKEIIQQHHGTVNVESEQGKGSTFCFLLPKRRVL